MARQWSELFITAEGAPAPEPDLEQRGGFLRRLRQSLSKTRQALSGEIQETLFQSLDEHTWERLEEALIMADVGGDHRRGGGGVGARSGRGSSCQRP